jgi:tetratricopeptide (TPR) repeat protein
VNGWACSVRTDWRYLLILAVISIAIYANSIPGSFVVDDYERWQTTTWIEGRPFWTVIGEYFTPGRAPLYRPIPYTLHAIDYHIWGVRPSGFHVTNIILHVIAVAMVYLVGLSILKNRAGALIAALFFATHPVHTEAVTYIAGRTDLTMTVFALLAFLLYMAARRASGRRIHALYAASAGAFILALMSKEAAVALPLIVILHHFYFRPKGRPYTWKAILLPFAPLIILVAAYLAMNFTVGGGMGVDIREAGLWRQMLTALRAFGDYLKALVFPVDPTLVLDYSWSQSFTRPSVLLPLLVSLGFLAIVVWTYRTARTVSFGLAWIAMAILPVSNVLAVTDQPLYAERFLYLPSVGFCLALGYLICRATSIRRITSMKNRSALTGIVVMIAIVVVYSLLTVRRNRDWISPIVLAQKTLEQNPRSPSAHINVGGLLLDQGETQSAISEFNKALKLDPDIELAHYNLGLAYEDLGDYTKAVTEYRRAIDLNAEALAAYQRLAALFLNLGMVDEAIVTCRRALSVNPRQVEGLVRLGNAYLRKGMLDEAILQYGEAVRLNPRVVEPYVNAGVAYMRKGMPDEAISRYKTALAIDPTFAQAYANLGNAYMAKGLVDQAIAEYTSALRLDPTFVGVHVNLSRAYNAKGMLDEAIAECERALAGRPGFVEAHINLAVLYYQKGDYQAALHHCDKAAELGETVDPGLLDLLQPYR